MLAVGDQYESEDVLIKAVNSAGGESEDVKLKDIRETLLELGLNWTTQKIHATLVSLGFEVYYDGKYDKLRANSGFLGQLVAERHIPIEP